MPENRRLLPQVDRSLRQVNPSALEILDKLVRGEMRWPLFLFGPPGSGKSCAALALCDIVQTAVYWNADNLASFKIGRTAEEVDGEYDHIAGKHLAVLDEIGERQKTGDLGYTTVKRFADVREQQAERVALYISNVTPDDIRQLYDDRIYSRLCCGTVLELSDRDRRITP